jgi:hypothetical protein
LRSIEETDGGGPVRFVVDVMLGKLAKWLRILGHDVLYSNAFRDEELARIAAAEDRCLLTRDRDLLSRFRVKQALLIRSVTVTNQLRELASLLDISSRAAAFSRCTACNAPLREVDRSDVEDEVPAHVYRTAPSFFRCEGCRKVYWPGTHVSRMEEKLKEVFGSDA